MYDLGAMMSVLPPSNKPLRIAVRQLHWFQTAFSAIVQQQGEWLGCRFDIDEQKLAGIFVRWLQSIEVQKPTSRAERQDFFDFAPALMLREMIADMPLKAAAPPHPAGDNPAADFWPEAYVCTMFCLAVHAGTMEQEFHVHTEVSRMVDDVRSWASFRENSFEDSRFAAGFFQKLLGHEPNWILPTVFRQRPITRQT